jgi:eukaryotic-like serine/threonine-protein kinase
MSPPESQPGASDTGALPEGDALRDLCLADPLWSERYEGWTELGSGGSATVVRTHSKASGEDIAVKVFLRTAADDWQRFQAEVRNAQALVSPFIVRTYSPFRRGTVAWIEMELVEGRDLRQVLYQRRPSVAEARAIGAAVAHALAAGHEAGIVHRDVKPANILLPASGRPAAKLGDFGTSRLAGSDRITHTGLLTGTPQFVAPEVVAGASAGPPADVYGLMLCLYLMLSGNRFPFDVAADGPVAQWLRAHTDAPVVPIAELNPQVPPALEALVQRGLDKDPARRPTAAEVASTLEELPVVAARPQTHWGAVVAVVLLLAPLLVFELMRRAGPVAKPEPPRTSSPVTRSSTPTPEPVATLPTPSVARSPAGTPPPPPAPSLRAHVQGEVLTVSNPGDALGDLRLVLVDSEGARHSARAPEGIASGEDLHIALDDFNPPVAAALAAGGSYLELRVTGRAGAVLIRLR